MQNIKGKFFKMPDETTKLRIYLPFVVTYNQGCKRKAAPFYFGTASFGENLN